MYLLMEFYNLNILIAKILIICTFLFIKIFESFIIEYYSLYSKYYLIK